MARIRAMRKGKKGNGLDDGWNKFTSSINNIGRQYGPSIVHTIAKKGVNIGINYLADGAPISLLTSQYTDPLIDKSLTKAGCGIVLKNFGSQVSKKSKTPIKRGRSIVPIGTTGSGYSGGSFLQLGAR